MIFFSPANFKKKNFSMNSENILAVIDIGSAETKVFILDLAPQLKIVGGFSGPTKGMRKGEIVNLGELKDSVHSVLRAAEEQTGIVGRLRHACLSVSGTALGGFSVSGLTSVKSGTVSSEDKISAENDAIETCIKRVPEEHHVVMRERRRYLLDGEEREEPRGLTGRSLSCELWIVDAADKYLTELYQIPNHYGMTVRRLFPASVASAQSVLTRSEMDKNRLVIDIGAGTSDFALYRNGSLALTGVVPVGGDHVTNDISHGLQIRAEDAERLKIKYGRAVARDSDALREIELDDDSLDSELKEFAAHVSLYKMELVAEFRLRELFSLIAKKINVEDVFRGTVLLTGGTSKMRDIGELASSVFGNAEVRLAEPSENFARNYTDPKYATVVGLAALIRDGQSRSRGKTGFIGGIRRFFRGLLR